MRCCVDCEYRQDVDGKQICSISSKAISMDVETSDAACKVCLSCDRPKQLNKVTASLICNTVRQQNPEEYQNTVTQMLPYLEKQISAAEKVERYTKDTVNWMLEGAKIRSDAEVARLFQICKDCDSYEARGDNNGACGICGCQVSLGGAFTNKLRRLGEGCPLNKW